jgi:hypothetical protein
MTSANATLQQFLEFSTLLKDLNDHCWKVYMEDGLTLETWPAIQSKSMLFLAAGTDMIEKNPHFQAAINRDSGVIFEIFGLLRLKHRLSNKVDQGSHLLELGSVVSLAIDVAGLSLSTPVHNLVGITPVLDSKITDCAISFILPARAMSINDRDYEDIPAEVEHYNCIHRLVSSLADCGNVGCTFEILNALSTLNKRDPVKWPAAALLELGLECFKERLELDENTKIAMTRYFSKLGIETLDYSAVRTLTSRLVNVAKSGLDEIVTPILKSPVGWKHYFQIDNALTLLRDIEMHTSIDVREMLRYFSNKYRADDMDAMRVILGYLLLTENPDVQIDMLDYRLYSIPSAVSHLAGMLSSSEGRFSEYSMNDERLREILAECMVKNPKATEAVSTDPFIGAVVTSLPGWFTHKLETDLGL